MPEIVNIQKTRCAYRKGNFGAFSESSIELVDDTLNIIMEGDSSSISFKVADIQRVQAFSPYLYLWVKDELHTISFDLYLIGQGQTKLSILQRLGLGGLPAPAAAPAAVAQVADMVKNHSEHNSDINAWEEQLVGRGVSQKRLKSVAGTVTIAIFSLVLLMLIVIILMNTLF